MGIVQKYFPIQTALERFNEITEELDKSNPNWRVNLHTSGSNKLFEFVPKHEKSEEIEPLHGKLNFLFPKTKNGVESFKLFQESFKKGFPVEISKEFIKGFEIPEFIKQFINPEELGNIKLIPLVNQIPPIIIQLEFESKESIKQIGNISLKVVRAGTEEILLTNLGSSQPIHAELLLNLVEDGINWTSRSNFRGINAKQAYDLVMFEEEKLKGGTFRIYDFETGFIIAEVKVEPRIGVNYSVFSNAIKSLFFLQQKLGIKFDLPKERDLTEQEFSKISELYQIVNYGFVSSAQFSAVVRTNVKFAQQAISQSKRKAYCMYHERDEIQTLLENDIEMGKKRIIYRAVQVSEENRLKISKEIIEQGLDEIDVILTPVEDTVCEIYYDKWLPLDFDYSIFPEPPSINSIVSTGIDLNE